MTLTRMEYVSIGVTAATGVICGLVAASFTANPFVYAAALGALGGLIHEFFQSGGKVIFFEKKADGMYLGSLAGMLMGAIAAMALAKGFDASAAGTSLQNLGYEAFMAGVTLKGIAEAASGQSQPTANVPLARLPPPPAKV